MKKTIKEHEQRNVKKLAPNSEPTNAVPTYLMDTHNPLNAKMISTSIKQQRKEKAARFSVPLEKYVVLLKMRCLEWYGQESQRKSHGNE